MAINTNTVTLGGSPPANSSFQTRPNGSGSSQVADGQNPDADPAAQPGGSAAAAQESAGGPVQATPAQKTIGPAAQTRANARTTRAPGTPGGSTATASGTDSSAAADGPNTDFLSVMATALGRSAATTAEPPAPPKATAGTADSSAPAQPAAATPTDAVAWIAQILIPPAAAAQTASTPGTGSASTGAVSHGVSVTAGTADLTGAGAGVALRNPIKDESPPQTPAAPGSDAKTQAPQAPQAIQATQATQATQADSTATTLGSVNAMADVQKLISGMTAAGTADKGDDTGGDGASAPATHAATATGAADGAQAAAALQAAGLNRSDSTLGNTTLSIQAPVSSAAFTDEVSARVTGLAQAGITQAQLQLSPADLGPVQVHITLQSGQASVWFGATHADTRAALEQSLPRLRELFAGAGMPLTDSGVFREPPQQQQAQSLSGTGSSRTAGSDTLTTPTVTQVANIRLALLDTYA